MFSVHLFVSPSVSCNHFGETTILSFQLKLKPTLEIPYGLKMLNHDKINQKLARVLLTVIPKLIRELISFILFVTWTVGLSYVHMRALGTRLLFFIDSLQVCNL